MARLERLQNTSLYFALRAVLRTFKIIPDDFVELAAPGSHPGLAKSNCPKKRGLRPHFYGQMASPRGFEPLLPP